jgi:hypothetical protein
MGKEEKYLVNEVFTRDFKLKAFDPDRKQMLNAGIGDIMPIRANIDKMMNKVMEARMDFAKDMKKIDVKKLNVTQRNSLRDYIDSLNYTDLQDFIKEQIW